MKIREIFLKVTIAVSILTVGSISALASDDYNCTQLMHEHGLATSAQANCGYESYSDTVIKKASQCMMLADKHGQADRLTGVLSEGVADFQNQYDSVDDKQAICQAFADNFPLFVEP